MSLTDKINILLLTTVTILSLLHWLRQKKIPKPPIPLSVNYHFTRLCNLSCGFCFHVEKQSDMAPLASAKLAIHLLAQSGMKKLNFAGGEPFLYPKYLGQLLRYSKEEAHVESCSIVSNGTKIKESFLREYGVFIDILAISCDSFDDAVNEDIGRAERGKAADNVRQLRLISGWCRQHGIKFKLNTVVNRLNWEEDMSAIVKEVNPFRWKCFQVLLVQSENDSNAAHKKGNFDKFRITDAQFEAFCERHKDLPSLVPESNKVMASSYLILDEHLCFLDKGGQKETASDSILDVGVAAALRQVNWDQDGFKARGGVYDWRKGMGDDGGCSSENAAVVDIEDL